MRFIAESTLSCQCVEKGKGFTTKSIGFSVKIDPKTWWKPCRKIYNFLFYVTNVFFHAGEHGECIRTFLWSYRREKSSKITLDFVKSIIIGIPIQMVTCWRPSLRLHHWSREFTARKSTSSQKFWELFKTVENLACRSQLVGCPRKSFAQTQYNPV